MPLPTNTSPLQKSTPAETPSGVSYVLSCTAGEFKYDRITDFRAAWSRPYSSCNVEKIGGTPSPAEKAAFSAAGKPDAESAKYIYSVCATTAGPYSVPGPIGADTGKSITAAFMLCPDHPKRAQMEANVADGLAIASDRANGKWVSSGKYLVGKTVQPGTWQSLGEKVEDCYWEISDAQGNILENNFINIAPQFTIYIPATAAGFTVQGCGFRWIGE